MALTPHLAELLHGCFHIDARVLRTWGFEYTYRSNPCSKLGQTQRTAFENSPFLLAPAAAGWRL
jgi:hypothetical protein